MRAASHTAAELMKLGQTKALRILDHHDRDIRNIHTDFDNGRGNKHLDFP